MDRRIIMFLGILLFLVSGCVSAGLQEKVAKLESEVATLKTQVRIYMAGGAAGTGQMRWRPRLTGTDGLDTIGCLSLEEGYSAIVPEISGTTASLYVYVWDEDSTASEDSPLIIIPNDRAAYCSGLGAWKLATIYAPLFVGSTADGNHFVDASNTGDLVAGERIAGRCWYNKGTNKFNCYNGTNIITIGP